MYIKLVFFSYTQYHVIPIPLSAASVSTVLASNFLYTFATIMTF